MIGMRSSLSYVLLQLLVSMKFNSLTTDAQSHCESMYSNRSYFDESVVMQEKKPIMLLSQPGSGNTWTRLLIEYSTGTINDFRINSHFFF